MNKLFTIALACLLILVSCGTPTQETTSPRGRIVLWHYWQGKEEAELHNLLDNFARNHDGDITIIPVSVPDEENGTEFESVGENLVANYMEQARQGLGPDIIIVPGTFLHTIQQDNSNMSLIRTIPPDTLDTSKYLSTAIESLQDRDGNIYGIPLSLHTMALYSNKTLLETTPSTTSISPDISPIPVTPPATLEALRQQADMGYKVAIDVNFLEAVWGIRAFGGRIFDEQGRAILNQGGFANWLGWLKMVQTEDPNIILSNDSDMLYSLFEQGEVAYYTGWSRDLLSLQETLGVDTIGVSPLPSGPNNAAGPLLETDALFFNAASSERQANLALQLAEFLTNAEQQTRMAREVGRIPANARVRVDPRFSPAVDGFVQQARTARGVTASHLAQMVTMEERFDNIYVQVLEGTIGLQEAANNITEYVNTAYDFSPPPEPAIGSACAVEGSLRIWHDWDAPASRVLQNLATAFMEQCPQVSITLSAKSTEYTLYREYTQAVAQNKGPQMLLTSHQQISKLAAEDMLLELDTQVEPDILQQYVPLARDALEHAGQLYGVPVSLDVIALYYNRDIVQDIPLKLDDLFKLDDPEHLVVIPIPSFAYAYWGIPAFGGTLFDEQGRMALDAGGEESGFVRWIAWLKKARAQPNVVITEDMDEAIALFQSGEAAYLVGDSGLLPDFAQNPGEEKVGVIPLPDGPDGHAAGPVLQVEALLINKAINPEHIPLALAFAQYVSDIDSQTRIFKEAYLVPANVNVDTTESSTITGFREQAKTASVLANMPYIENVWQWGNTIYQHVIEKDFPPLAVASHFSYLVNNLYDLGVSEETLERVAEPPLSCSSEGDIQLWHTWQPQDVSLLEQLIIRFREQCPDISVATTFVRSDLLEEELALAQEEGNIPDILLTHHTLIDSLNNAKLIQDIEDMVGPNYTGRYQPLSIDAIQREGRVYGMPVSMDLMALYVNQNLVQDIPITLDELRDMASAETPVALDISYLGGFWGIPAFGGAFVQNGTNRSNDKSNNIPTIDETSFTRWLRWLKDAQRQPGIILDADPTKLQQLFANEQAAYLVAGPDALAQLNTLLGSENLHIALLPSGPEGDGAPLLQVETFLFPRNNINDAEQRERAYAFAQFVTSKEGQDIVIHTGKKVPTNNLSLVEQEKDTALLTFVEQAWSSAIIMPAGLEDVLEEGNSVYTDVLYDNANPAETVQTFHDLIKDIAKEQEDE